MNQSGNPPAEFMGIKTPRSGTPLKCLLLQVRRAQEQAEYTEDGLIYLDAAKLVATFTQLLVTIGQPKRHVQLDPRRGEIEKTECKPEA